MSQIFYNQNYYELFNVSPDATAEQIKYAYARLIRQYTNEASPEEFMHIREAYQVLSNPTKRNEYNNYLFEPIPEQQNNSYDQHTYYENSSNHQNTYENQQNIDDHYQNTYDDSYVDQQTYQDTNRQYYQNEYREQYQYEEPYEEVVERPKGEYGLFRNIVFSIILSLMFTPIVGIIAGVVIHYFKIPIARVLGCIFWVFVALFIFYLLFG